LGSSKTLAAFRTQKPASNAEKLRSSSHCSAAFSLASRNAAQVCEGFSAPAWIAQLERICANALELFCRPLLGHMSRAGRLGRARG
jgi:hypothetical protein